MVEENQEIIVKIIRVKNQNELIRVTKYRKIIRKNIEVN